MTNCGHIVFKLSGRMLSSLLRRLRRRETVHERITSKAWTANSESSDYTVSRHADV